MWDDNNKDYSVVGVDLVVTGNINCKSSLLIDGQVDGNVTCESLLVSKTGKVNGDITTNDVRVEGMVSGMISSGSVDLKDGCVLEGDIASESLSIDHGASFTGSVKPQKSPIASDLREAAE